MARSPTPEQLAALNRFAREHGRFWKSKLRDEWLRDPGPPSDDYALRRQVRNQFGPAWLETYKPVLETQ